MPTTTRWGIPTPAGSDVPDVPASMLAMATSLDNVAKDDQGTLANRPSAADAKRGFFYKATDVDKLYRSDGTNWEEIPIDAASSFMPVAAVVPFAGSAAPAGFLICDGAAVSRSTYAALFGVLATLYGAGNGSTTFNVPDLRGRVAVGKGTHAEVDTLGESDGLAVGSRKVKHKHGRGTLATVTAGQHQHNIDKAQDLGINDGMSQGVTPNTSNAAGVAPAGAHTHTLSGEIGDTGGPLDAPAHIVLNHIIKT